MSDIAFLLEAPEYRSDRRVLELSGELLSDCYRGHLALSPQDREELMFEVAERGKAVRHIVTLCNM
jgi:hypothetical protein